MQLQTLFGAGWLTYLFLTPGWAGEIKAGELSSLTQIVDEAVRSNPEIHAAKRGLKPSAQRRSRQLI